MISIATTLRRVTASACSISCRRKSYATFRLGSYPSGHATRRVTEKRCGPDGETGPHMKAVPKASHTDGKGFGTVRQKCRDTSPSPTIRDAPWEHDQGEKPQGSGAQSVPCYVRIVGMGEKLRPKAICKTVMLESRPPACG